MKNENKEVEILLPDGIDATENREVFEDKDGKRWRLTKDWQESACAMFDNVPMLRVTFGVRKKERIVNYPVTLVPEDYNPEETW